MEYTADRTGGKNAIYRENLDMFFFFGVTGDVRVRVSTLAWKTVVWLFL